MCLGEHATPDRRSLAYSAGGRRGHDGGPRITRPIANRLDTTSSAAEYPDTDGFLRSSRRVEELTPMMEQAIRGGDLSVRRAYFPRIYRGDGRVVHDIASLHQLCFLVPFDGSYDVRCGRE